MLAQMIPPAPSRWSMNRGQEGCNASSSASAPCAGGRMSLRSRPAVMPWHPSSSSSSRIGARRVPRSEVTVSAVASVATVAIHHAATAKMLMPLAPVASISHAWQLVARGAVRTFDAYEDLLVKYPLPVKMATGAFGTFLGDLLAQFSTHFVNRRQAYEKQVKRQQQLAAAAQDATANSSVDLPVAATAVVAADVTLPEFAYNWQRAMRYVLFYTFIATPVDVYFYDYLDQTIMPNEPNSIQGAVEKMLADELLSTPLLTMGLFAFVKTLEGVPEKAIPLIKDNLWPTLMANYQVWPLAQVINFLLVPAADRILYIEVVSVFWVAFLSFVVNSKETGVKDATALEAARLVAVQEVETATVAMASHFEKVLTHTRDDVPLPVVSAKAEQQRGIAVASATLSAAVAYASAALTASTAILVALESDVGNVLIMAGVSGTDMALAGALAAVAVVDAGIRYANLEKEGREEEAAKERATLAALAGQYKPYQGELERRSVASLADPGSEDDDERRAPRSLASLNSLDDDDARLYAKISWGSSLDEDESHLPTMSGKRE